MRHPPSGGGVLANQVCDGIVFTVDGNFRIRGEVHGESIFLVGVRGLANRHRALCLRAEAGCIAVDGETAFLLVGILRMVSQTIGSVPCVPST